MRDEDIEHIYPHKKGDILCVSRFESRDQNEWNIKEYLIGGYTLINLHTGEVDRFLTEDVDFAEPNLKKIFGHENHEVVVTYVSNPKYDRYIYCRDCKKEIKTKYKKIPKPREVFFYER
jgi:hypothetical protein